MLPTVIQAQAADVGFGFGSWSYAFSSDVTAGSLIVVGAAALQEPLSGCTDSQGNVYTLHGAAGPGTIAGGTWLWSTIAGSSGPLTVTVAIAAAALSFGDIALVELADGTTYPVNAVSTGTANSTGPAATPDVVTDGDGIVIGLMSKRTGGGSITPPAGWTEVVQSVAGLIPFSLAYIRGAAGTYHPSWAIGGLESWSVIATGFDDRTGPSVFTGSLVAGVHTTVAATRAISFGLDGDTHRDTDAGTFTVHGHTKFDGDTIHDGDVTVLGTLTAPGVPGAPTDASYVTIGVDSELSAERVLTAGTGITITDGGPGSTVTIAATGGGGGSDHYDCPLSDGDLTAAEIIFASGECVIVQVPV